MSGLQGLPVFESLEPRLLLSGEVMISEFMASNNLTIDDGDGGSPDWIELYNPGDVEVDLADWFLTDDEDNLEKWRFPDDPGIDTTLSPGEYRIVFASGEDIYPYVDPQGYLHTNFKLSTNDSGQDEDVLLVRDDGATIEHGHEDYPEQFTDISYGIHLDGAWWETLVDEAASLAYLVPTAGDAGDVPDPGVSEGWTAIDFDDSAWTDSVIFGAAGLVISEINTGTPNFVEIQNVSADPLDTAGWTVLVNDAVGGDINTVNPNAWSLTGSLAAGEIAYRSDDPGDNYWGGDILWDLEGSGWAMVIDGAGEVMDFVAWGYTAAEIAALDISYDAFPSITVGVQWSGNGASLAGGGEPEPEENVVAFGSVWDYMHPTNGVDPAGADADFNSTWMLPAGSGYDGPAFDRSGEAILGFGMIDYGPIRTNIGTPPSGSRYTAYFRSEFVLDEPMIEMGIEILNDDGAFVYIDGAEVMRNNISAGKIDTYTTFADSHTYSDGVNVETETRTFSIADLEAGTHTIAVSVHEANTGSSDLGLDLRLFGRPVPGGELLRRIGQTDSDTVSDFKPNNDATKGTQNPGLTVPFGLALDTTTGIGFSDDQPSFEDVISTDVGDEMEGVNASLWTRIEFMASENISALGTLTLSIMYDDGFVAYLNGVEIARRNAPAALAWDSSATAAHSDILAVIYEEIDVTASMGLLLEGANVLAIHGLNYGASDADLLIRPKLVATGDPSVPRHFADATPKLANNEEWWHYVEDTTFSHDRGFYTTAFDLAISTDTVGAQIYYTTNGTKPLMPNGAIHADATEYTAPITIDTTTVVRAVAVKDTYAPTNVDTQTYLFLDDVINQPTNPAGFPDAWGGTTADYEMDPDVVLNPTYQSQMINALTSIPTMSISMDVDDMFGSSGIYTNSGGRGLGWERETSLEYFDPNSTDEFQVDAGLRIYGGAFRGMGLTRKKSFRVLFKGIYGPTKLDFPLFDAEDAATSFDNIVLRAGANDGWNNWGKANTQYIIDEYMRQLQLALEQPSGHGTFVHLYINGLYWGLYNPIERPEASFCATYFGGDKEDWDALNSGSPTGESNTSTWNAMLGQVRAGPCTDEAYQKIQGNNPDGTNNRAYNDMLDVDNYIAYMFSNIWGGTGDWPGHNWYAAAQRPPEGTGWKFFNWDAEGAIVVWSNVGANRTGVNNSAAEPYAWLRGNAEFNLLFGDYAHKWMFNDGPAAYTASYYRYYELANEIELAVIGESARWGDQAASTPYTQAHWATTRDNVLNSYMSDRPTNVLNQLKAAGLYPNTVAPVFEIGGLYRHGGEVLPGAQFSIEDGSGTIYYTTDGTDPRQMGGAAVGTQYSSGQTITLTESTRFRARRLVGGQWSALNDATFYVNPPIPGDLAVTELNYNPYGPTNAELLSQPSGEPVFTASDFEFIELYNKSGRSIDLLDMEFRKGIEITILPGPQTILASGQYAVIVANASAFEARYGSGINVVGVFTGSLSNGGDNIIFGHPVTLTLEAFEYNDAGSWPNRADGGGSSLELIDVYGDLADGSNWRSSSEYGGSPGLVGAGPRSDVVVNEVLTHSDDPLTDSIELYNTTDAPIDVSGWFLSDGGDYAKFEIPAGTVIPAGGHVVFYEGHYVAGVLEVDFATEFGGPGEKDFALSGSHGDDVWLLEADASGKLLNFMDHVDFGGAVNGESLGHWPDGSGDLYPMTSLTAGDTNSPPRVGPVIISEVMYHALDPDGPGGVEMDDLEFIELYNPTPLAINLARWQDNPHGGGQYFADWRIRGGVDMEFDAGTTIAAGGLLVVLSFDPSDPANATRLAGFRTYYGIDTSVPLTGGYSGKMDNGGDNIRLQRPDSPPQLEPDYVPHVPEDQVRYDDLAPWAISPDGLGDSLQRMPITGWGDDPANWIAAPPDPGAYLVYDNAPVVVNPIADVTADEDSGDDVLDLSATFEDPDGHPLTLSVSGNSNDGLVTANMDGTDLTLSYLPDQNGSADITIRAMDSLSARLDHTFTVTVNPLDDDPVLGNPIVEVTDDEDASDRVIDLTNVFDDPDLPADTLVFAVTNNTNISLVTTSIVDGDLVLSYVPDQNGTGDVTVRATDRNGAGVSVEDTFTVTVDPVNDNPLVANPISDMFVDEDDPDTIVDLSNVFDDPDLPTDTLSPAVWGNSNTNLVTTNLIGTNLTLSFVADQIGTADIEVRTVDSGGLWISDTFTVTVNPINDAPTVSGPIDDILAFENDPDTVLDLSGVFADVDIGDSLTLSVSGNTNPGLVTADMVGSELTLSYLFNQYGTAEITVRATDSGAPGLWVEDTFTVSVDSDNFAPIVANPISDVTVNIGSSNTVMYLSDVFDDSDGVVPTLDYTAVEIDPVTGAPSAGTGLFRYKFTLYGHDGVDASFATTSLTFSGNIQQPIFNWNNVDYPAHDEATADLFHNPPAYNKHLDTWRYSGWTSIAPGDSNLPPANVFDPGPQDGDDVIVSAGSGTDVFYEQKDVVQIVALGDVTWSGQFARRQTTYNTSGTANGNRLTLSVEDNTNPDLVTASMLGSRLTLAYAPGAGGEADITVRATDSEGAWVEETFTVTLEPGAEVVGRHIFYNNSAWDAGGDDDAAIDPIKTPLLPQGTASSDNYTSYSRGINGIMVDIDGLTGAPAISDIGVRVNQAAAPDTWSTGPAPESVTVRAGEGVGGSDRVTLVWADGAITSKWVEVSVLPGANTGLGAADVFYAGNIVGDTNDDGKIDASDLTALVSELGMRGGAELLADLNIDGRVNLTDSAIMRSNFGTSLGLPTMPPAAPPAAAPSAAAAPVSEANVDILAESATSNEEDAIVGGDAPWGLPPVSLLALISLSKVEGSGSNGSPAEDISGAPAISGGLSATRLQRAATSAYDLRPLGEDPASDAPGDDLLADILAESALGVALILP
jgi:hypothetical protein